MKVITTVQKANFSHFSMALQNLNICCDGLHHCASLVNNEGLRGNFQAMDRFYTTVRLYGNA